MSKHADSDEIANRLIGRSLLPDEQKLIDLGIMDASTSILHLRAFLEHTQQLHMERARFRFAPDGAVRLVVIGEHAVGVARALATRCELPVIGRHQPPHIPEWWDDLRNDAGDHADYLILEGRIADERTVATARDLGLRTIRMQAVEFAGLHPDAMFVPKLPLSPPGVGGWHSALIASAVLNDIPSDICRTRFSAETYASCGYFDRYDEDIEVLHARDRGCDAGIADLFSANVRDRPLLRTPLDGSPLLYDLYVEALTPLLGLKSGDRQSLGTETVISPIWPIMPDIVARHRLNYATPLVFGRETEAIGLDDLIQRCYNNYRWWPREVLAQFFGPALRERNL